MLTEEVIRHKPSDFILLFELHFLFAKLRTTCNATITDGSGYGRFQNRLVPLWEGQTQLLLAVQVNTSFP
jgi:hypothetical protein